MSFLTSKPKMPEMPKVDNSAEQRAKEQAQQAEVRQRAIEEAELAKKKHVGTSGRKSTILAGDDSGGNTVLGG